MGGSRAEARSWQTARVLVPVAVGIVALLPALGAGFVHDDQPQILHNPLLRSLANLPQLWSTGVWAGAGSDSSWYRPLMTTSFAVDHALFGFDPVAMHAVQLGLFAALVALGVALAPGARAHPLCALFAGALFAVHPLCAEPAVWISGRPEILAGLGGLAAVWLHRKALGEADPARARRLRVVEGFALAMGLFGKETAVAFLALLLASDWVARASLDPRALLARYAAPAAACLVYAALRVASLGGLTPGLAAPMEPGALLGAVGQGVLRIAWPAGLTLSPHEPGPLDALVGAAVLLGAVAAAVGAIRRRSEWLLPLALGLPHLCIAALAAGRLGELADRYLLQVTLAAAWAAALAFRRIPERRLLPATAAIAACVLVLGAGSWRQAVVFQSNDSLWSHAYRLNPDSVRAAVNLASAYLDSGRPVEALELLDRAEELAPGDRQVAINRAGAAWDLGRPDEARGILEALLERHPADPSAHIRLGHLALERGDPSSAAVHYDAAVRVHPLAAEAWAGLGVALFQLGRLSDAAAPIARALELDPTVQNADRLRQLLRRLNEAPGRAGSRNAPGVSRIIAGMPPTAAAAPDGPPPCA